VSFAASDLAKVLPGHNTRRNLSDPQTYRELTSPRHHFPSSTILSGMENMPDADLAIPNEKRAGYSQRGWLTRNWIWLAAVLLALLGFSTVTVTDKSGVVSDGQG
jgi:hypothetical protein